MRQLDLSGWSGLLLPVHGLYITSFFGCCQSIFEHNTAQKLSAFIVGFSKILCFLMTEKNISKYRLARDIDCSESVDELQTLTEKGAKKAPGINAEGVSAARKALLKSVSQT